MYSICFAFLIMTVHYIVHANVSQCTLCTNEQIYIDGPNRDTLAIAVNAQQCNLGPIAMKWVPSTIERW